MHPAGRGAPAAGRDGDGAGSGEGVKLPGRVREDLEGLRGQAGDVDVGGVVCGEGKGEGEREREGKGRRGREKRGR
jgi:hypothetical protein